MARRRPRRFARAGGPKNNVWTTVLQDEISIGAAGILNSNIVQGTDWERASGATESATCMSIRGHLTVQSRIIAGTANGPGAYFAYIGVFDEDETPPDASLSSTYADEIIMWTGGHMFGAAGDTFDESQVFHVEFDVKVQRTITNGKKIVLSQSNGLTTGIQCAGVQRALLRLGGN